MRRALITLVLGGFVGSLLASSVAEAQRGIPINIESVPPGATVFLDSTASPPLGTTPLANVRVPSGDHTFIFQLSNHEEAQLRVSVRRRRETFRAVLRALGVIEISAGNPGANGATARVDGRMVGQGPLGSMPVRVTDLQPGRHQVRVEREGYVPFEQWVDVSGGQVVRIAAMLERAAPDTGSILVSGPPGAPVFLDGTPHGVTPTVIDNVTVGAHTVEVRAPGQQPFSQQVTVLAGQRATVAMPVAGGGTLRVLASAPGAIISIDGEVIGPSPAVRESLAAGEHIVEANADGYEHATQTVTVENGQQRVVQLQMQRQQGEPGRIVVQSNVDGATVTIDNEERGNAPVVHTPEPGPHAIVVRAAGHQEYSTTCTTSPGHNCEINAVLVPQQVRVRVAVQPGIRGAELFVDGERAGPVPYEGTLPAGSHVIEVRAEGYENATQQADLMPSNEVRAFDMVLPRISTGPTEEELQAQMQQSERRFGAAVTHAAGPLPVNQATIDLSIGWPYLGELRLNVGLLEFIDAGFAIRSFGRLTEFEGRARVGYRPLEQLAVGVQARFGGGIGPQLGFAAPATYTDSMGMSRTWPPPGDPYEFRPVPAASTMQFGYPTNSAFFILEAMGSLYFSDQGAFTIWLAVDMSSDEYAGHPLNSGVWLDVNRARTGDYCSLTTTPARLSCPREDYARARLGGSLELVLTRNWNLWFLLEGILSSQPRRIMGNLLGIEANDTQFYFRIGTTYKF